MYVACRSRGLCGPVPCRWRRCPKPSRVQEWQLFRLDVGLLDCSDLSGGSGVRATVPVGSGGHPVRQGFRGGCVVRRVLPELYVCRERCEGFRGYPVGSRPGCSATVQPIQLRGVRFRILFQWVRIQGPKPSGVEPDSVHSATGPRRVSYAGCAPGETGSGGLPRNLSLGRSQGFFSVTLMGF